MLNYVRSTQKKKKQNDVKSMLISKQKYKLNAKFNADIFRLTLNSTQFYVKYALENEKKLFMTGVECVIVRSTLNYTQNYVRFYANSLQL